MKRAAALLLAIAGGLLGASCEDRSNVVSRADNPSVVSRADDDAQVNLAADRARQMLPYFWAALEAGAPSDSDFTLKVGFATPDGGMEHLWVADVARADGAVAGVVVNEPLYLSDIALDQEVTFSEAQISDWGFLRDGLLVGHYTTRVLLEDLPREEAELIRSMLGEAP